MKQYSNHTRQNRKRGGFERRHESGRSEFLNILIYYVLPFVVVNAIIFILVVAGPKGTVTIGETSNFISTNIELKVKSLLPIKAPILSLDGTPITITKTGSKTYTATLTSNGVLEVDLESVNKMKNVFFEQVNVLDDAPPTITDRKTEDGILTVRLEDSQSGLDYSSIHAIDDDGRQILPLSIDQATGTVTFPIKKENLTVCAKDKTGHELRETITPSGESIDPDAATDDEANGDEVNEDASEAASS